MAFYASFSYKKERRLKTSNNPARYCRKIFKHPPLLHFHKQTVSSLYGLFKIMPTIYRQRTAKRRPDCNPLTAKALFHMISALESLFWFLFSGRLPFIKHKGSIAITALVFVASHHLFFQHFLRKLIFNFCLDCPAEGTGTVNRIKSFLG